MATVKTALVQMSCLKDKQQNITKAIEKGSHFAARGQMLPPYDTRETLRKLANVIDTYDAATVIALGDSLHDATAAERIDAGDLETLRMLQEDREWIWNRNPRRSCWNSCRWTKLGRTRQPRQLGNPTNGYHRSWAKV